MSALILKIVACLTMLLDHVGYLTNTEFLRVIGRISLPIFAYLIASGYKNSKDPFKYLLRICVFALISEPVYDLCFRGTLSYPKEQNIMFTLALGLAAIIILDRMKYRFPFSALAFIPVGFLCYVAEKCELDYGMWVILLIVAYWLFDGKSVYSSSMLCLSTLFFAARFPITYYIKMLLIRLSSVLPFLSFLKIKQPPAISNWHMMQIYSVIAVIFILLYNGKRGLEIKNRIGRIAYQYSFYAFYPLHLLLLFALGKII